MSESDPRRMDAYYYSFTSTGLEAADKMLGAVACAGKAFHHTQYWCDDCPPYDDHKGAAPVDWIQNAAQEAADTITRLTARVEELEAIAQTVAAIDLDSGTEHDEALMMLAIEQSRAAITKGESDG